MTTIEQNVVATGDMWDTIRARIFQAVRNLRELSPGYPTTTVGHGSPGGGKGGGRTFDITSTDGTYIIDRVPVSSVEADFITTGRRIDNDPALVDLARIRDLTHTLHDDTRELHNLIQKWSWPNAGQWTNDLPRTAMPTETETNSQRWCTSCARLRRAEPVYRGTLCHWCYTFNATEGHLPSMTILDRHARGERVTTAMVTRDKKQAGTPPRTRNKRRRTAA